MQLVWNGCDGFIELDRAQQRGYDVVGDMLYTQRDGFQAFEAQEIDPETLPTIDGEIDTDGVLVSESGRYYRAI